MHGDRHPRLHPWRHGLHVAPGPRQGSRGPGARRYSEGAPGMRPTKSTSAGLCMGVTWPVSPKQRQGTAAPQTESGKCAELGGPVELGPRSTPKEASIAHREVNDFRVGCLCVRLSHCHDIVSGIPESPDHRIVAALVGQEAHCYRECCTKMVSSLATVSRVPHCNGDMVEIARVNRWPDVVVANRPEHHLVPTSGNGLLFAAGHRPVRQGSAEPSDTRGPRIDAGWPGLERADDRGRHEHRPAFPDTGVARSI